MAVNIMLTVVGWCVLRYSLLDVFGYIGLDSSDGHDSSAEFELVGKGTKMRQLRSPESKFLYLEKGRRRAVVIHGNQPSWKKAFSQAVLHFVDLSPPNLMRMVHV